MKFPSWYCTPSQVLQVYFMGTRHAYSRLNFHSLPIYIWTISELQFEIKTKGYNPIDVQLVTVVIYLSFAKL